MDRNGLRDLWIAKAEKGRSNPFNQDVRRAIEAFEKEIKIREHRIKLFDRNNKALPPITVRSSTKAVKDKRFLAEIKHEALMDIRRLKGEIGFFQRAPEFAQKFFNAHTLANDMVPEGRTLERIWLAVENRISAEEQGVKFDENGKIIGVTIKTSNPVARPPKLGQPGWSWCGGD